MSPSTDVAFRATGPNSGSGMQHGVYSNVDGPAGPEPSAACGLSVALVYASVRILLRMRIRADEAKLARLKALDIHD